MPVLRSIRALALPALVSAVLAVSLATAPAADASSQRRHHKIGHARDIALNQIGDRYAYGASGPRRFDCSGLVYYSYRHAGFRHVPRTSAGQAARFRQIPKRRLRSGDFMYFRDGGGVYHVGIFLRWQHGRAVMVHAPGSGQRVRRAVTWTTRWTAGTLRKR